MISQGMPESFKPAPSAILLKMSLALKLGQKSIQMRLIPMVSPYPAGFTDTEHLIVLALSHANSEFNSIDNESSDSRVISSLDSNNSGTQVGSEFNTNEANSIDGE